MQTAEGKIKVDGQKVVLKAEWLAARKELLAKEKEFTRARDAVSAERRKLPWIKVEKDYAFDAPGGKVTMAKLFEGKNQLIVYHFMFSPEWEQGCSGCSLLGDHFDGPTVHMAQRDVAFTAVSRAPLAKIEAFKKRMGWRFNWVSSFGSDFNYDYRVSFTKDEMAGGKVYNFETSSFPEEEGPGLSVFYKKGEEVFHTYSTYGRGLEDFMGVYRFLDLVPKGRDEGDLPRPMAWVRHHDQYSDGRLVDLK
jgi:predicted dithiol-disulfide oxidoreductase (DUF899 family)